MPILWASVVTMSSNPAVDLSKFTNVAPAFTSCGDLTRLNIMEHLRPCSGNKTLVVEDIDYTNRYALPSWSWGFLEYDGIFRLRCYTGAKHATQKQVDDCMAIAKVWFDRIFSI